jgi:hypothetical protein
MIRAFVDLPDFAKEGDSTSCKPSSLQPNRVSLKLAYFPIVTESIVAVNSSHSPSVGFPHISSMALA